MHCLIIILITTILLFHKLSNASNNTTTTTICDTNKECKCNDYNITCMHTSLNLPIILPNNTVIVHFVNISNYVINQNTFVNGLQSITWVKSKIKSVEALCHHDNNLKYLDLSSNNIFQLSDDTFNNCLQLEYVDLSHNQLNILSDIMFLNTIRLETVKLEYNLFNSIPKNIFKETSKIKNLSIGNSNLSILAENVFSNLDELEYLSIENNIIKYLNKSSFGYHEYLQVILLNNCTNLTIDNDIISSAPNIEIIELMNCGQIHILPPNLVMLKNLKQLKLYQTEIQPNCHNGWFSQWYNNETTTGIDYETFTNFMETLNKIECSAKIYHISTSITLQLTKRGIIDCMAYGNPRPAITYLAPGGLTFHENKEADKNISDHPNMHDWNLNSIESQTLFTSKNGSLHIIRMLRSNIGNYTCYVSNVYGNDSKTVQVHLDSGVFFSIKINAIILGVTSALGFLVLTILCCAFKLLLIRLNCIKKRSQPREEEMEHTEKTKTVPEDV